MRELRVELGDYSYNIFFDKSFLNLCDALKSVSAPKKLLIVNDSNVERLYANEVCALLNEAGYDTNVFAFDAGEENKNMDTILRICEACLTHQLDRKSMIVALGGGVVGDMAGFAASIYMRGIDFIQIPTTLLSQSDSSVGGKTGVDFMNAKNILGAFHQPKMVYINVSVLKTLPQTEFISGMGEVIKHGVIRDREFFDYLLKNADMIKELENNTLLDMSYKNCSIKADVVSRDEFEKGLRADLNFGHTIGHAVESYLNFSKTHGECVAIGMVASAYISFKRGLFLKSDFNRLIEVLKLYEFSNCPEIKDIDKVKELMQKDKKKSEGKLKFILPQSIGKVFSTYDISNDEIDDALKFICTDWCVGKE